MADANQLAELVFPTEFGMNISILLILAVQGVIDTQLEMTVEMRPFSMLAKIIIISIELTGF